MNRLQPLRTATRNGFTVLYASLQNGQILLVILGDRPRYGIVSERHFRRLTRGYAMP